MSRRRRSHGRGDDDGLAGGYAYDDGLADGRADGRADYNDIANGCPDASADDWAPDSTSLPTVAGSVVAVLLDGMGSPGEWPTVGLVYPPPSESYASSSDDDQHRRQGQAGRVDQLDA